MIFADEKDIEERYPEFDLSDERKRIIELLDGSGVFLNVVGKAGTGKSVTLSTLKKILEDEGNSVLVCTSTGVASAVLNADTDIKACTIHSVLHVHPQNIYGDFEPKAIKNREKIAKIVENTDYLFIDEASMITSDLLDFIMGELFYFRRKARKPMVNVILFGDVMQLPPVVNLKEEITKDYFERKYGGNRFYFNSTSFRKYRFKTIQLEKIYRQKDDLVFAELLGRIRNGKVTDGDISKLNERVLDEVEWMTDNEDSVRICTTNRTCDVYNSAGMSVLDTKEVSIESEFEGDFKKSDEYRTGRYPDAVTLKKGMHLMITANDSTDEDGYRSYVNGDTGILEYIGDTYLEIKLSDDRTVKVTKNKVPFYEYDLVEKNKKTFVTPVEKGSWKNFPVKTCYAVTTWKCQGATMNKGIIELGGWQPPATIYVALSRFRHLDDFILTRKITKRDVCVDKEAQSFLESL